ncbi:DUF7507 domain-containing protein [Microbacterium sp. ASV49]|uniref:SdrD B-like domain-containing protein n=1 Tax=Microbacterium candidum TaxID=3041922 RepID=A0ABT7MWF5_9MICO|nr:SdrD B-like domain-containing protein [Microbacterium sp. ASV49]MDL9978791.1 SdrD B-like domain-containing protein [Microbacterium sp. ASV49]
MSTQIRRTAVMARMKERRSLLAATAVAVVTALVMTLGGQAAHAASGQLVLEQLPMDNACQGLAKTGTPPFDATDGPGLDSGSSNCIVRVNDSVFQNYSVSLTGLDAGQSAKNVVLEFTIHPTNGAKIKLTGPLGGGMPDGCLSGAGITPASSQTTNPDGSVTVVCNQGTMSSNVAVVQLVYAFAGDTPIPATAQVTAKAYTADPLISPAPEVTGPVVTVTGTAAWEIKKTQRTDAPWNAPYRVNRADGTWIRMVYWLDLTNQKATSGGSDLQWPATFNDRLAAFPNAIIEACYVLDLGTVNGASGWTTSCPTNQVQGPKGWPLSLSRQASGSTAGVRLQVNVLIPQADFYHQLNPSWQQGDLPPSGTVNWQNALTDTDGWHLIGGQLNNPTGTPQPAPGFEPGWDGTTASGDNVVTSSMTLTEPQWDLAKTTVGSAYQERDTDFNPATPPVRGFLVTYRLGITESNGTILTDPLNSMHFTDVLSDVGGFTKGAILTSCGDTTGAHNAGTLTCGATSNGQTAMTYTAKPNQNDWYMSGRFAVESPQPLKNSSFDVQFFIPVSELPPLCTSPLDKTYNFTNEARDTEGWTAGGWPINRTGLEPGWDPVTGAPATGNNITTASIRFNTATQNCGTLTGDKQYEGIAGGLGAWNQFSPGDVVNSHVWTTATAEPVTVGAPNLGLCDVFDVSVWRPVGDPLVPVTNTGTNPHLQQNPVNQPGNAIVTNPNFDLNNYVIEYAVGTNSVNTQTGTGNGLNAAINTTEAAGCRDNPGPWSADPATAFGSNWRDQVNMVRVRPKDPTRVEAGPFTLGLYVPLQARWQYNGGPNAGQTIPVGIQFNNVGAFPQYDANRNIQWVTQARQVSPPHPTSGAKDYTYGTDPWGAGLWADGSTFAPGTQLYSRVTFNADSPHLPNTARAGSQWGVQTAGGQGADTRGFPVTDPMVCDTWDVSTLKLSRVSIAVESNLKVPSDYVIEYGVGSNTVNTQAGAKTGGYFPVDSTAQTVDAAACRNSSYQWTTDPTTLGANWQDKVNMVRMRPKTTGYVEYAGFEMTIGVPLTVRSVYNGGPNAGEKILTGVRITNSGSWPQNDTSRALSTVTKQVLYTGMLVAVAKSAQQPTWLPGSDAKWTIQFGINKGQVGALMERPQVVDTIPSGLSYNDACTKQTLPAGSTTSYNPVSRQLVITLPDITVAQTDYWVYSFSLCTTIPTTAQPGTSYINTVSASSLSSENNPTAQATTSASGSGQLGIDKSVDKPLIESGETYNWRIEWVNTSRQVEFAAPDVIDVLPWNGDAAPGALSKRDQYASNYNGTSELTGALPAPTYTQGKSGVVPGTWYYATAPYATIDPNPKSASNANPADPGGLWLTEAEITDFSTVTAIRFVSGETLAVTTRVAATVPMVAKKAKLGNLYVNRAMIYSGTVANQQLLSTEPTVLVPGFSLGDLVWLDKNLDGRQQPGEPGIAGVKIELLDDSGAVVATTTTDANGRWHQDNLPAGTYKVRIPASEFQAGGPLASVIPSPSRNGDAAGANENVSNNNTPTIMPSLTGLTSSPITLAYQRDASNRLVGGTGTGHDVAGFTPANLPESFTDYTIDLAMAPVSGIAIKKYTNGQDADTGTGPNVTVGSPVKWTYVVTNTGGTDLTSVTVTDDKVDASQIDCGTGSNVVAGPVSPGASFTCIATGTAAVGQYANTGTVSGTEPQKYMLDGTPFAPTFVTATDPSHYFGVQPAVTIKKATNGQDADTGTGPLVNEGAAIRWTYVVKNAGNVPLTDVTVTDDKVDASQIDCGTGSNVVVGPLAPGATFTCTANGTATVGQYANVGTVVGTAPTTTDVDGNTVPGATVTDEDPSHYLGIRPQVSIVKSTNGQDADEAPGPLVAKGGDVRWTYVVTNTGDVPLTNVTVTDDKVAAADIDCLNTGSNIVAGPLAPGETFTCTATGTAMLGQYANLGTVTGTGPETTDVNGGTVPGKKVTAENPSHYVGIEPSVGIKKYTNGQDADTGTGPDVTVGGDVRWTYVVTNTGNAPLTNVTVTDDKVDAASIDCSGTGSNVIAGPLTPGASFTCAADGTATLGQYANTGSVTGTGPETTDVDGNSVPGATVQNEDPSHYFGIQPQVTIKKATNGQDADTGTGPIVNVGSDVRWTYVVKNTGNVPLTDVTVTDDKVAASDIVCEGVAGNIVANLAAGDSVTCTATGKATVGQYANMGTVVGTGPTTTDVDGNTVPGSTVTSEDPSHYFGIQPKVSIVKSTNGEDANEAPGPLVAVGGDITWTYVVTNTGTVPLTDVTVTDDKVKASEIDCDETGSNVIPGPLEPGASFTCTATGTATAGQYANMGTVTGIGPETTDVDGKTLPGAKVTAEDPSHYFGVIQTVDIVKSTTTTTVTHVGQQVPYTFTVTNTGNVPLEDVTVTDSVAAPSSPADLSAITCAKLTEPNAACSGTSVTLAPGQTAVFTAIYTATQADLNFGSVADTATAKGNGPLGTTVQTRKPSTVTVPAKEAHMPVVSG